MKAISGLLGSRKAVLVILVIITLTVLLALGKIDKSQFESLLKYIIPAWLGSHAWEEGKKAEGGKTLAALAAELMNDEDGHEEAAGTDADDGSDHPKDEG